MDVVESKYKKELTDLELYMVRRLLENAQREYELWSPGINEDDCSILPKSLPMPDTLYDLKTKTISIQWNSSISPSWNQLWEWAAENERLVWLENYIQHARHYIQKTY
jgi:hypothetical protein